MISQMLIYLVLEGKFHSNLGGHSKVGIGAEWAAKVAFHSLPPKAGKKSEGVIFPPRRENNLRVLINRKKYALNGIRPHPKTWILPEMPF